MFTDGLEPADPEAEIWRFMNLEKFRDFLTTGELFFCRADLFKQDESEGIPPAEYQSLIDWKNEHDLLHHIGSAAQFREGFYISCWALFHEETASMWKKFAIDGVAIRSTYGRLKSELSKCDHRAFLGLMRYGTKHLSGWNFLRFITTKKVEFATEREVRALIWAADDTAGINRHFDENNIPHSRPLTPPPAPVPAFLRIPVLTGQLLTGVIVSPWANDAVLSTVKELVVAKGLRIPTCPSALTRFRQFLP